MITLADILRDDTITPASKLVAMYIAHGRYADTIAEVAEACGISHHTAYRSLVFLRAKFFTCKIFYMQKKLPEKDVQSDVAFSGYMQKMAKKVEVLLTRKNTCKKIYPQKILHVKNFVDDSDQAGIDETALSDPQKQEHLPGGEGTEKENKEKEKEKKKENPPYPLKKETKEKEKEKKENSRAREENPNTITEWDTSKPTPPTPADVAAYAEVIGLPPHEATAFYDHFAAIGWAAPGGRWICDYRAAMRRWKVRAEANRYAPTQKTVEQKPKQNIYTLDDPLLGKMRMA